MANDAWTSFPVGGIAVVFGAGGGIGSALAIQLCTGLLFKKVVGFSRTSEPAIDLLTEESLKEAAAFAATEGDIRLVVDATGFLHDKAQRPEKCLRELDPTKMARSFALNAIGPALIMKHVLPLLPREGKSVFATLSARVGSIGDNELGGWYSYRASKAGLNQLVRTASIELRRRQPEAICVALHPGTVDTLLSSPFSKADLDVQSPELAAKRLLAVVARLSATDSGGFFDHRGEPVPW
ncbi:MAG: SDR family NAD(P)-dependent oxidoreductase [Planctomycetaceae bacterium]|nr:MAG: SDR family NAD(P)-dependent oxidoreductase [Planctomycetaceae bacterium]